MPVHEHDCDNCEFLSTDKLNRDWYVCTGPLGRSIIVRYSSEPSDYISSPVNIISRIVVIAKLLGFQFNEKEKENFVEYFFKDELNKFSRGDFSLWDCEDEENQILKK